MKFYLTSLEEDNFILDYLFLYAFNPDVNWHEVWLLGRGIWLEMIPFLSAEKWVDEC